MRKRRKKARFYQVVDPASQFFGLIGRIDMAYGDYKHTGRSSELLFLRFDRSKTGSFKQHQLEKLWELA